MVRAPEYGPINKVLIANRGEIALRVQRACRELGLQSVAVYSDVDRQALHVRYASQAFYIGPAPARESYLNVARILDTARRAEADAIHPGYGFLAERADFAAACREAGFIFIGPPAHVIAAAGDKQAARQLAASVGAPVIPGSEPGLSDRELMAAAPQIGFPLLVKAVAGGGGKGMRRVEGQDELPGALAAARREAEAAFGVGALYLERVIEGARHIEFQIMADWHGNVVHLYERECSLQRRRQKLLEEAPSPFMDDDLRQRMGAAAVAIARAAGYVNAGTVEFLVDADKNFYFLEMNTRIQVEHPITEAVTGIDLVKEQLRIARGRRLSFHQEDIRIKGWAIECRINAEDPYNNFMPSVGVVSAHLMPAGPGVRVDTAAYVGMEITPNYDSLIAKLICYGNTRAGAIVCARRALDEYRIMGLRTNIPFHQRIIDDTRFIGGQFDTTFVEEQFTLRPDQGTHPEVAALVAALVAHHRRERASAVIKPPPQTPSRWKWALR